uniref:GGDEF domain-containing protein n=1 Tax=Anisakis simplex TaxID=6269 RepID=A0A0M3JN39_ANISI
LIVSVAFLLERSDWSRYESYRLVMGIAVSFYLTVSMELKKFAHNQLIG